MKKALCRAGILTGLLVTGLGGGREAGGFANFKPGVRKLRLVGYACNAVSPPLDSARGPGPSGERIALVAARS
jgi:hypothetical protein